MSNSNESVIQIIENILLENLEEDYDDLERPDYYAMLYAIRDVKEFINGQR